MKIGLFVCDIEGTFTENNQDLIEKLVNNIESIIKKNSLDKMIFSFMTNDSSKMFLFNNVNLLKSSLRNDKIVLGKQFLLSYSFDAEGLLLESIDSPKVVKMLKYVWKLEEENEVEWVGYADDEATESIYTFIAEELYLKRIHLFMPSSKINDTSMKISKAKGWGLKSLVDCLEFYLDSKKVNIADLLSIKKEGLRENASLVTEKQQSKININNLVFDKDQWLENITFYFDELDAKINKYRLIANGSDLLALGLLFYNLENKSLNQYISLENDNLKNLVIHDDLKVWTCVGQSNYGNAFNLVEKHITLESERLSLSVDNNMEEMCFYVLSEAFDLGLKIPIADLDMARQFAKKIIEVRHSEKYALLKQRNKIMESSIDDITKASYLKRFEVIYANDSDSAF